MRTLTRLRASQGLSPLLRISHTRLSPSTSTTTPTLTPTRQHCYSSLRPLLSPPTRKRPTLPPTTKTPINTPHHRSFTLLPLLETALSASHTLLTTLHTTAHTPWYLTIPLFALALNLTTRLPTMLYSRRVAVRRQHLEPLTRAGGARVHAEMAAEYSAAGSATPDAKGWMEEFHKRNMKVVKGRMRRWGVQMWKDWVPALAVFPVWILGVEALRRMCGGPRGVLGSMVFGRLPWGGAAGGEGVAQGLGQVQEGLAQVDVGGALATASGYVADPSMAVEGCLWFGDLTAADPLHVLPIALSVVLVGKLVPKTVAGLRVLFGLDPIPMGASKTRARVHRVMLILAMVIGPMTMDLPAALHLYWLSTAVLTTALAAIVSRLMPIPKTVPAARKDEDVLIKPTREEAKKTPDGKR